MTSLANLKKDLRVKASPKKAAALRRFFKTGPGEYGEGDVFLGITVPESRALAKKFTHLPLPEIKRLLVSKIHEERLVALLLLVQKFHIGNATHRERIVRFYLQHTKFINNWDLVDLSADKIIGRHLLYSSPVERKKILMPLARSNNMWERRIAMIATFQFIKHHRHHDTLMIAKILLHDTHDLIHKAVGWMLREIGKQSLLAEERFLEKYAANMPRTMLRYAIERFPIKKRLRYVRKKM